MQPDEPPRVLVVEDDVHLAELICDMLSSAGMPAIFRTSVTDALDVLSQHAGSIAVLMTDINLLTPMSGIELAVYAAQEWPSVVLCVTTGGTNERPRRLPDTAMFLSKPWDNDELIAFVRKACVTDAGPAA